MLIWFKCFPHKIPSFKWPKEIQAEMFWEVMEKCQHFTPFLAAKASRGARVRLGTCWLENATLLPLNLGRSQHSEMRLFARWTHGFCPSVTADARDRRLSKHTLHAQVSSCSPFQLNHAAHLSWTLRMETCSCIFFGREIKNTFFWQGRGMERKKADEQCWLIRSNTSWGCSEQNENLRRKRPLSKSTRNPPPEEGKRPADFTASQMTDS